MNEILINSNEPVNNNNDTILTPSNSNHNDSEIKNFLREMGYEQNQIESLFQNIVINSIEQAIEYLAKGEDNLYNHTFIPKENNLLICKICNDSRNYHHNRYSLTFIPPPRPRPPTTTSTYRNKLNNNRKIPNYESELNIVENENDIEDELEDDCDVCMANKKVNMHLSLKCEHHFCRECWENYLKEKITNNFVIDIKCMDAKCNQILVQSDIRKILFKNKKELFVKYKRFFRNKVRENALKGKKFKHCPKENCEEMVVENPKTQFVECANGHRFCFECLEKWHENKKCKKNKDIEKFNKWKNKKHTRECPNCLCIIEKNGGCNHMTCQHCKYQWCWICGGKYTIGHYSSGPCAGMQFRNIKYIDNKCVKWFVMNLSSYFIFMSFIILFSLFGAIGGLGFSVVFFGEEIFYDVNRCHLFVVVAAGGIIGVTIQPLVFSISMIFLSLYIAVGLIPPFAVKINNLIKRKLSI